MERKNGCTNETMHKMYFARRRWVVDAPKIAKRDKRWPKWRLKIQNRQL